MKIYISDEGFGHIVRQRAIVKELYRQFDHLEVTIQTSVNYDFAIKNIQHDKAIRKFNNIVWHKNENRSPDPIQINEYYRTYAGKSEKFIEEEVAHFDYDFVITDFCYEAFEIAKFCNVPSFGVCHFTWDWFLENLFDDELKGTLIPRLIRQARTAEMLFFPPFTPPRILQNYENHLNVPFIVKEDIEHKQWSLEEVDKPMKILFMDSGAGIMRERIIKVLSNFNFNDFRENIIFGLPSAIDFKHDNVFNIPSDHLIVDYVQDADFVVGRPGFNTVSECLSCKVPMILISETMNPEMEHNIAALLEENVVDFLTLEDFQKNFETIVKTYINEKLDVCNNNLLNKDYGINGAEIIVESIKNTVQ